MRDPQARKRARSLRRDMTKSETVLWTALKGRALDGWKFRRQHPVGPYIADFACLEAKLIVEVDGATHNSHDEIAHDRQRTDFLESQGFAIVRITNTGIYEDLDGIVRQISAALAPSGPSGHLPRKQGRTSDMISQLSTESELEGAQHSRSNNGRFPT
ncbi:MAG: DUF559 domain-containing protein [Alphaproteobacteria bacterium]|nr:DUF559 domain-containing protein [Alphaproteobacteria bacterium]